MASHAAAGDPRVRSHHDPRSFTSQGDDIIRKRKASRSPAVGDKAATKKLNQAVQTASSSTGNQARQSSININDPRRSNVDSPAGSRRNSISLNTNGVNDTSNGFRHPNGQTIFPSPRGTVAGSGSSTPQSSVAPVAFMSGGAPSLPRPTDASANLEASIFDALMDASDQAAELVIGKIAFNEAGVALRKAEREYNVLERQFVTFPAIKEQKTAARMAMQKRYDEVQKSMQETKIKQQKAVGAAATTIAGIQQSLIADVDHVSPAELNDLRTMAGQGVRAQSRIGHLENQIATLKKRLDEALVDQHASKAQQHTTKQFAALEERVNETRALAERLQVSAPQQLPVVNDTTELTDLKERVEQFEGSQEDQLALLEIHANAKVAEKVAEVSQWAHAEIQNLKANITATNKAQHANAQTIDECLSSVDSLRANLKENVSQSASKEELDVVKHEIGTLTVKVDALQPFRQNPAASGLALAADPSNPLGLAPFKQIIPAVKPKQPAPFNPTMELLKDRPAVGVRWNDWIESHIGALLQKTDNHTMRLNNTTTDALHDAIMKVMKEKYNKEYPDLVNWAATVQEINAAHERDVGQLRTDVTSLKLRVEAHEYTVSQGQQKFSEMANEIKAISQEVVQLQGAQERALERASQNATS